MIIYDSDSDGTKLRLGAGGALIFVAGIFFFGASKFGGTQVITSGSTVVYKNSFASVVFDIIASVLIFAAALSMISAKVRALKFLAVLAAITGLLALLGAAGAISDHVIISDRSLTLPRVGFFDRYVELPYADLESAEFQPDQKQIVFHSKAGGVVEIPMTDLVMASIGKIRFALMSHGVEISNR
ncbi:MAG TPA: hypothetical protein VFW23_05405 [Tepidisphaeraceae bacterium]|nr:hypothetical protein [Tepidisphaeraceae bacterium]